MLQGTCCLLKGRQLPSMAWRTQLSEMAGSAGSECGVEPEEMPLCLCKSAAAAFCLSEDMLPACP